MRLFVWKPTGEYRFSRQTIAVVEKDEAAARKAADAFVAKKLAEHEMNEVEYGGWLHGEYLLSVHAPGEVITHSNC